MSERTDAEIEAALTAYHGVDAWDHNDRADMRAALAAADAVAPADARIEALEAEQDRLLQTINLTPRVLAAADLDSLNKANARIEELEADLNGREAICDSYADENQRFFDRIEALEAAGKRLADVMEASGWIEFTGDEFGFRDALAAWRAAEKGGEGLTTATSQDRRPPSSTTP